VRLGSDDWFSVVYNKANKPLVKPVPNPARLGRQLDSANKNFQSGRKDILEAANRS